MKEKGGLNILDALENLNTLVDADSLEEIEVTDDSLLIPHKGEREGLESDHYWVHAGPDYMTLGAIKDTFHSVHTYLQAFYSKKKVVGDTRRLVEGINTVMVLVGEAAKNFERFGTLFKQRISDLEEYRALQNFYRNRVIQESFRKFAQIPLQKKRLVEREVIPEQAAAEEELLEILSEGEKIEERQGVHLLNDLDVIRRDHLYELFFLKNESGQNFYTYELARTIKLACDFGEYTKEYFGEDPLLQIKNWEDKSLHLKAEKILKNCSRQIENFYKEAMKHKGMDLVIGVHNALMALKLAANPRNLIRQFSLKGANLYFNDFILFLREVLKNREYQKFLIFAPPPGKPFFQDVLETVQALCYNLFATEVFDEELKGAIQQLVERVRHKPSSQLSEKLWETHHALFETLKKHPNGPVFKVIDIIREEEEQPFDPLLQGNIPAKEWSLTQGDEEVLCLRMPCPIQQQNIGKAYILEEFKTFLGALKGKERLLGLHFQDRTSWREHARAIALEELSRQAEFATSFVVVTLAKDTDFYNQRGEYLALEDAALFIDQFLFHLSDESTGYYFPPQLKLELFPHFMKELLECIHKTFFDKKRKLSFIDRLDFIEIAYCFIELKILEVFQPTVLTFFSKDGLDISGSASVGLIALLSIKSQKKWEREKKDRLMTLLFGPTLICRERDLHTERFERLLTMIQRLEQKGDYLTPFAALFQKKSLNWKVNF